MNTKRRRLSLLFLAGLTFAGLLAPVSPSRLPLLVEAGSKSTGAGAVVHLSIVPSAPSGQAQAVLTLDPSDGVRGFDLLLQFDPGRLLSGTASDFVRNEAFLPAAPAIGGQQLNRVMDAGAGRIRLIGLAPVQTTGALEVGRWHLHLAPGAPMGATQVVTVTGEINDNVGGVTTIEPVVAIFRVIDQPNRIYLPLLDRSRKTGT